MKVIDSSNIEGEERSGGIFIGTVEIIPLLDKSLGSEEMRAALVNFPKGVRNKFHNHTHEQILFVTQGEGIVATEDMERRVEKGDLVFIPKGEKHWHGATEESSFQHLFVINEKSRTSYDLE
jgi:quercetin dioxygenase-like cupin family protein